MLTEIFIQQQIEETRKAICTAEVLKKTELKYLIWRENETSWNILECLEHLNLYGDYYLPKIEDQINKSSYKSDLKFKSGFLGNYFAKSMLPKEKPNKMKTFKDKNPKNCNLNMFVIDRFISQQHKLLELLQLSKNVSLNKVKISTSISKLIRLKLGDIFHFIVNHNIRHLHQINNIQMAIKNRLDDI